jgi:hypothetical protein
MSEQQPSPSQPTPDSPKVPSDQDNLSSSIPTPIQGRPVPEDIKNLVKLFSDLDDNQLTFLDDASKNIIERISTFLVVLFGVTAFGTSFPPKYLVGNTTAKIFVIITLILYLAALGSAIWNVQPKNYRYYLSNITRLRAELDRIKHRKIFWLRLAGILFTLGTVFLALLIISLIWNA